MQLEIDYEPHEYQKRFHESPKQLRLMVAGIRSGKSLGGVVEGIMLAAGGWTTFTTPNRGCIVSPTYTMTRDVLLPIFFEMCPKPLIKKYNKQHLIVELVNGSIILFRTAERPERLYGLDLHWYMLDEAANVAKSVFDVLEGRIAQKQGCGWITTAPRIENQWIPELITDMQNNEKLAERVDYINFPSSANPYFPQSEIDRLRITYTEEYFECQVSGNPFVRVPRQIYKDFNPAVHIKKNEDEIAYYVAGIDFGFAKPTSIIPIGIKEEGGTHIPTEFYQSDLLIGEIIQNLKTLHADYKFEKVFCDPSNPGYIKQIRLAGFNALGANNDVAEGITLVTGKLRRQTLTIDPMCENLIREFLSYKRKPNSEQPVKQDDHCFIAGTKIASVEGEKNIEDIKLGDSVLTRSGWRKVLFSGKTQEDRDLYSCYLSNGRVLCGTGDHPIFVKDRGFIPMDALRYGFILENLNDNPRWTQNALSTKELNSGDILNQKSSATVITTGPTYMIPLQALIHYIGRFGKIIMAGYLQVITSIISMAIPQITTYPILNASHNRNITTNGRINQRHLNTDDILRESVDLQRNGIDHLKDEGGIANMVKKHGRNAILKLKYVISAEIPLRTLLAEFLHASAPTDANQRGGAEQGLMILKKCALSAANSSRPTNMIKQELVRVLAVQKCGKGDVYDLTVEGIHEFYAEGILVHNCLDALRYGLTIAEKERKSSGLFILR